MVRITESGTELVARFPFEDKSDGPRFAHLSDQVDYFARSVLGRPTRAMVNARQVARKNATASIR